MGTTIVDRLHGELSSLLAILDANQEISLRSSADDTWRKSILISAASHFEHRMTQCVLEFVNSETNGNDLILSLIKMKAVHRQYHTWFDWDSKNANSFFRLFGDAFKSHMIEIVKKDQELDSDISAFLEIGGDRNRLIHQDFGTFTMEKTADEIYEKYRMALRFVDKFPDYLAEFSAAN